MHAHSLSSYFKDLYIQGWTSIYAYQEVENFKMKFGRKEEHRDEIIPSFQKEVGNCFSIFRTHVKTFLFIRQKYLTHLQPFLYILIQPHNKLEKTYVCTHTRYRKYNSISEIVKCGFKAPYIFASPIMAATRFMGFNWYNKLRTL